MERLEPQLSESNAVGCRPLRSPLHVSTGGAPLVVLLRRAVLPPILDAGSRRSVTTSSVGLTAVIVHFCATDARTCSAGWPGRRVYHFNVWRPVTISAVGASAQASCRNRESVPVGRHSRWRLRLTQTRTESCPCETLGTPAEAWRDQEPTWRLGNAAACSGSTHTSTRRSATPSSSISWSFRSVAKGWKQGRWWFAVSNPRVVG